MAVTVSGEPVTYMAEITLVHPEYGLDAGTLIINQVALSPNRLGLPRLLQKGIIFSRAENGLENDEFEMTKG